MVSRLSRGRTVSAVCGGRGRNRPAHERLKVSQSQRCRGAEARSIRVEGGPASIEGECVQEKPEQMPGGAGTFLSNAVTGISMLYTRRGNQKRVAET